MSSSQTPCFNRLAGEGMWVRRVGCSTHQKVPAWIPGQGLVPPRSSVSATGGHNEASSAATNARTGSRWSQAERPSYTTTTQTNVCNRESGGRSVRPAHKLGQRRGAPRCIDARLDREKPRAYRAGFVIRWTNSTAFR